MLSLTANFSGTVREETLDGRQYWVIPTRVMRPMVMNGSRGPVMYRERDIKKFASAWDMKPAVVYHPEDNQGNTISAANPKIISKRGVGFILDNYYDGSHQVCETWIDQKKADKVDPRIRSAIENGIHMSVSSGLDADRIRKRGRWQGVKYRSIASNYRPDHLALLPDQAGACSLADGCGLITSSKAMSTKKMKKIRDVVNRLWKGKPIRNCSCKKKGKSDMKTSAKDRRKISANANRIIDRLIGNGKGQWTEKDRKTLKGLDFKVLRRMDAARKELKLANAEKKELKSKTDKFRAKLAERRAERLANSRDDERRDRKHRKGKKITNSKPKEKTPRTPEEFLKQIPADFRGMFANGLKSYKDQRKKLVKLILANEDNKFDKKELLGMEDSMLHKLAAMAAPPDRDDDSPGSASFDYFGQQGAHVTNSARDEDDDIPILEMPSTIANKKSGKKRRRRTA